MKFVYRFIGYIYYIVCPVTSSSLSWLVWLLVLAANGCGESSHSADYAMRLRTLCWVWEWLSGGGWLVWLAVACGCVAG